MRPEKRQRPILTVFNGRTWVNVLEGKGPFRGSFASREAAAAVGRAHAADAKTVHFVHDESGEIVETKSFEEMGDFTPMARTRARV